MSGLGEHDPTYQSGAGGQVSPVNLDRYEVYQIFSPQIGTDVFGTIAGTNASVATVVWAQVLPDYPRSVSVKFNLASGSIGGGTFTLSGKNQFGELQTENFSVGTTVNGGTVNGTKVWAQFGTMLGTVGTGDPGSGTLTVYPTATGTTALFGLPTKIGGTADVLLMSFGSTGISKAVNGGTIGAFVDATTHSIKAPNTLTTAAANATWINVWFKSTWSNLQRSDMAGLKQI